MRHARGAKGSGPSRRGVLLGAPGMLAAGLVPARVGAAAETPARHRIDADSPASEWLLGHAVGNGRLGAMMSGGVAEDTITLNHDSLWTGQPAEDAHRDGRAALAAVRDAVFAGDPVTSDRRARALQGPYSQSYAPMAELSLAFDHAAPRDYRRTLDLDRAIASVSYRSGGVGYRRELFSSFPDQVIVLRISADRPGALTGRVTLATRLRGAVTSAGGRLTLTGKAPTRCEPVYRDVPDPIAYDETIGRGMAFATIVSAEAEGGAVRAAGDTLHVRGADALVLRLAAATGFRGADRPPDLAPAAIVATVEATLAAAEARDAASLRARHLADHRALYRRAELSLDVPGDAAAARAQQLFHLGRYLLIASSRAGTAPANLQGIWNAVLRPPWSSNYTTNINLQMNYWPAESAALAACHAPLIDHIERLALNGQRTARTLYGLPGWCVHHNTDLWAMTHPVGAGEGDPNWANWPMAAPWLAQHLWDHYRFGGDRDYLAQRAFPLMRGAAEFCAAWLVRDAAGGGLTTAPSISPENLFLTAGGTPAAISAGCTMDLALIRELFANCLAAAAIVGEEGGVVARLPALVAQLAPYRVGRFGQLQEWSLDYAEQDPGHRHLSHLYPVYPGDVFGADRTPALMAAARAALERREAHDGPITGWSRAWATALWARLGDGAAAGRSLAAFLAHNVADNLLDTHPMQPRPVFQIDGNLGITAAIVEMLVQSHDGALALLPALPPGWHTGRVSGLCARGGHHVALAWDAGTVRAEIVAGEAPLEVRAPPRFEVSERRRDGGSLPIASAAAALSLGRHPGARHVLAFRRVTPA